MFIIDLKEARKYLVNTCSYQITCRVNKSVPIIDISMYQDKVYELFSYVLLLLLWCHHEPN